MSEDKIKWDTRFSNRPMTPPIAPGFLEVFEEKLNGGRVLDLASGDGAVALYLACKGFDVTAVDISAIALQRLQAFAKQFDVQVATCEGDLKNPEPLVKLGVFDNIVISRYKPPADLWPVLITLLRPGGKLLLSTFNEQHHRAHGFSLRFCLAEGELINISDQLVLEHYASVERGGSYMDDYLFYRV